MPQGFAGAVLTGGASRRMGRDKALIEVGGVAMARRVADVLRGAGADPVVAVGGDRAALTALGLGVVTDPHQGEGPLGGIVAALAATVPPVLVVVACDLPRLTPAVVAALVEALDGHDVALARTDRLEPLCGAWRVATAGPALQAAFAAGVRAVHRALGGLDLVTVAVEPSLVANVNRPEDLPPVASTSMPAVAPPPAADRPAT